ncbi:hypothetical protein JYT26_01835 [Beggiatoa alba]|nr:hypothetical protein [Beggiatoa alba]
MQTLLANPAIQSAVAPFIVALLVALLLRRFETIGLGLAIIAGLLTTVMLTTGLTLQPLTSTRKIIVSSLCLPFTVLLVERIVAGLPTVTARLQHVVRVMVPTLFLMAAACWVIWPVLTRQGLAEGWPMLLRVGGYAGIIGAVFLCLAQWKSAEKSAAQGMSALMLAIGTGVTCLIAATALYAQLAFAIAASVGSVMVLSLFTQTRNGVGHVTSFGMFAAAVPLALFGAAATVYAQLPPWVLPCLVFIPLFAGSTKSWLTKPWQQLIFTGVIAFLPVIPASGLAWRAAGPISF